MSIAARIMAHPARKTHAETLQAELDRDTPIIYDTNPQASADPEQRWATGRAAWLDLADSNADWSLVLQDDAVPCRNLIATLVDQRKKQKKPLGV